MAGNKLTREDSIKLLITKQNELIKQGINRFPKRSDFTETEVVAIKAFLGPWPRALELAGIKAPRDDNHLQKIKEKRIRAKRNRVVAKKKKKVTSASINNTETLEGEL